jgi:DtxR family transcriptional regulator, Mn-dependent transcriptional regulator
MISAAIEDYVKGIYRLQGVTPVVTVSALAEALHVSAASSTNMVKKLSSRKLVRHSPYRGVELTKSGEKMALEVVRHHRLIELFLQETLDLPWDRVHAEAEKIEHVLSEDLEDRIAEKLGDPTADPHGDPIPTKGGKLVAAALQRLADLAVGESATIRRVDAQEPEQLRYLGHLGVKPNTRVQIVEQIPFGGPMRVRVGTAEHVLDESFTRKIWVARRGTGSKHSPRMTGNLRKARTDG